ncbi:MAG: hypothetical protein ABIQ95_01535 [Bdellovibrionia bacterium]
MNLKARSVTRFQVMAMLQTARAQALGLQLKEAKSWGLNRALFYAAAKSAWAKAKSIGAKRPVITEFETSRLRHDPVYVLGGEKAFRARNYTAGLRFKFGHQVQTPEDFDRQVKERLGPNWRRAWLDAVRIIRSVDQRDLDIQSRFFNVVYKPRRDILSERWSAFGVRRGRSLPPLSLPPPSTRVTKRRPTPSALTGAMKRRSESTSTVQKKRTVQKKTMLSKDLKKAT